MRMSCNRAMFRHTSSSTASVMRPGSTAVSGAPCGSRSTSSAVASEPADARDHDFAHGHAGPLREQQQVGAVLQLLRTRERERRSGILVPEQAPHLGEQARVVRVAADHLDRDRIAVGRRPRRTASRPRPVPPRARGPTTVTPSPDSARPTCSSDGVAAGVPTTRWNAAATPHASAMLATTSSGMPTSATSAPSRAERQQRDDQPARRPQQVRRRDQQHRRRDCEHDDRVLGARAVHGETGGAAGRPRVDPRPQPDARGPAERARDDQEQQQPEPAREQEREREHHDRADRPDVVEHLRARTDPRRQVGEDVEESPSRVRRRRRRRAR